MSTNDPQRWETYKGYRIKPDILMQFDGKLVTEHGGKWIVPNVIIQPEEGSIPLKTLKVEGLYVSIEDEAPSSS